MYTLTFSKNVYFRFSVSYKGSSCFITTEGIIDVINGLFTCLFIFCIKESTMQWYPQIV